MLDPNAVVAIGVFLLIALILAERPIWLALLASGGLGVYLLRGSDITLSSMGSLPYSTTAAYSLFIIPMFILMGTIASKAGLAADVYAVAQRATHRLPGGLGIATILACGGFAAVTGSSVATVATIGRIAIKQMTDHGYKPNAAASIVAVGGTLGVLIPPSVILVVYGILTGESIGMLLMAGIIPGIISIIAYSVGILIMQRGGHLMEPEMVTASARQSGATAVEDRPAVDVRAGAGLLGMQHRCLGRTSSARCMWRCSSPSSGSVSTPVSSRRPSRAPSRRSSP